MKVYKITNPKLECYSCKKIFIAGLDKNKRHTGFTVDFHGEIRHYCYECYYKWIDNLNAGGV